MRTVQDTGNYTVKETGETVNYSFEYTVYEASDGCENPVILGKANRQEKVDANNETRVKERARNGHSDRKILSPEEKAERKVQAKANRELLKALVANPDLLAQVQNQI